MSWVFLTDDRVYKLKKPVRYPFLDFKTLSRRKFFCAEEMRLNRRLASETYQGIVPLSQDRAGNLSLSRPGGVVDWLVEMKRLPDADMLDARLSKGNVTDTDARRIGDLLAGFYATCAPEIADGDLYLEHLTKEQSINRTILRRPELGLRDTVGTVLDTADRALEMLAPKIRQRIAAGHIVEGHGDLRPEHVHLGEPLQVIDCLEFSRPMRIIDPFDEVNYLGLECAMLGAPWVRAVLLKILTARLGEQPERDLLALYGGFRALLRARLCVAHLLEAAVRHPDKWKPLALSYIALAKDELSLPCRRGRKPIRLSEGASPPPRSEAHRRLS